MPQKLLGQCKMFTCSQVFLSFLQPIWDEISMLPEGRALSPTCFSYTRGLGDHQNQLPKPTFNHAFVKAGGKNLLSVDMRNVMSYYLRTQYYSILDYTVCVTEPENHSQIHTTKFIKRRLFFPLTSKLALCGKHPNLHNICINNKKPTQS